MSEITSALRGIRFKRLPGGGAVAETSRVGRRTFVGRHVTIYPSVTVGADCIVMDGAVIGRIPISNGTTNRPISSRFEPVIIGDGSIIGCQAAIYTNTRFGRNVLVGDLASLREGCDIGDGAILGRGVMALYNCTVGRFSRIQDQAHLVGNMIIEEHVFIGMGVVTTNDDHVYLSRFGLKTVDQRGPTIRRLAVVAAGATILPDLEIGEGALVAAGAVVTRDVPPWSVVAGVPATVLRSVPDEWRRQVTDEAEARERSVAQLHP